MKKLRRFDIQKLLADPDPRRRMIVRSTVATQAREGIDITENEAENSYYVVTEGERSAFFGLVPFRSDAGEYDGRHVEFVRCLMDSTTSTRTNVTLRDFSSVQGSPLAYDRLALVGSLFRDNPDLDPVSATVKQGLATSDDDRWLRFFWEVLPSDLGKDNSWCTFAKGGQFSRFYFNHTLAIRWKSNGAEIKAWVREREGSETKRIYSQEWYFVAGLTWPRRTAKRLSVRILPEGCIFADKGPGLFPKETKDTDFLLGVTNSRIFEFLFTTKTSFSWEVGIMKTMPVPGASKDQKNCLGSFARTIHDAKFAWDTGNEICTRFDRPWVLQPTSTDNATTLSAALDTVLEVEADLDAELHLSGRSTFPVESSKFSLMQPENGNFEH